LRLSPVTVGAESIEFGKMMLGVKAEIPSEVVLLSAQFLVGEFLNRSAVLADHEAMTSFCSI
jgi:hypothetical protein